VKINIRLASALILAGIAVTPYFAAHASCPTLLAANDLSQDELAKEKTKLVYELIANRIYSNRMPGKLARETIEKVESLSLSAFLKNMPTNETAFLIGDSSIGRGGVLHQIMTQGNFQTPTKASKQRHLSFDIYANYLIDFRSAADDLIANLLFEGKTIFIFYHEGMFGDRDFNAIGFLAHSALKRLDKLNQVKVVYGLEKAEKAATPPPRGPK
jgi:hypothetical protein